MLARENRAGGLTKMNENYTMRQTHDVGRMMKGHHGDVNKAFAAWRDMIMPLLDNEATFGDAINPEHRLRQIFDNLVASEHSYIKGKPDMSSGEGYARPGSLARRIAGKRVLHFKNADAAWKYNEQFGALSLRDGIVTEISRHAGNTAMMENFGADPDGTFNSILKTIKQKDRDFGKTIEEVRGIKRMLLSPQAAFDTLMGYNDNPANPTVSKITRNILAYQTLSKLGGVAISAIPDKAFAHLTLTYHGL